MDECCVVCADPLEWTAYGPCGHTQTCSKCVARLRFVLKDKRCVICQQETDVVFFTRHAGNFTRKLTPEQFHELQGGREFRHLSVINGYFDDAEHFQSIKALCSYTHPEVGDEQRFTSLRTLKGHIREHLGKQFCDICLTGRKVFVCEQLLYTPKAAKMHKTKGDLYGPLAEGGFKGHPMCEFCRNRFFSETELFKHNSEKHETCFLCRQENPHIYRYYRDYADLEGHFKKSHFPCDHPQCLEAKFVVFRTEAELVQHRAFAHERREGGRAQRQQANAIETNFRYGRPIQQRQQRGRGQQHLQVNARQEYAPSDRVGDGAEVSPDPNGFPENRPVQLTEEDFPSFGDVPCPTQGTWPVRGGRTGSLTGGAHFPSLPRQAPEGRPQVVRRGGETMASRVAATRSPVQTRPGGAVENLILQSVRRPASMPSLRQGLPTETKTANWPVQRERKEPAAEPKSTTAWVTLSKGGSAKDFPSLSGEEAHRVASKPKWGLSQEQPAPEPKPQPRPAAPSISDTSAFPSLAGRPSPARDLVGVSSGASSSAKVSEGIKSANKVLIKKLKSQMDSATFQEFHSDAQVFLREGLSADVFHRRLVDRGLAHYVAEVASLCPILSRGQELLSVHSQFIDQCREDPDNAPIVVPVSVLEQSYGRVAAHLPWQCSRCTTVNLSDADFCEACDTPRHAARPAVPSRPDPVPLVYRRQSAHSRTLFGVDDASKTGSGANVWTKRRR